MKNSTNLPRHAQDAEGIQRLNDKVSFLSQLKEQDKGQYLRQISPIKQAIKNNGEYEGFSDIQLREIVMQLEVDLEYCSSERESAVVETRGGISCTVPGRSSFSN